MAVGDDLFGLLEYSALAVEDLGILDHPRGHSADKPANSGPVTCRETRVYLINRYMALNEEKMRTITGVDLQRRWRCWCRGERLRGESGSKAPQCPLSLSRRAR